MYGTIASLVGTGVGKAYSGVKSLFGGGGDTYAPDDPAHPSNLENNVCKWIALIRSRGWSEERYQAHIGTPGAIAKGNEPYLPKRLWASRDEWLSYALAADPAAYEAHRHHPGGETMPPQAELLKKYGSSSGAKAGFSPELAGAGIPGGLTLWLVVGIIVFVAISRK